MVELNLKIFTKKYPNSEHYSVEDFNLNSRQRIYRICRTFRMW